MSRWNEKLDDFTRALSRLSEAIDESTLNPKSSTLKDGVIHRFEFTYELCWKLMKYFLEADGVEEAKSPRSTFRAAFQYGLIKDGEAWIDMLKNRNLTSHVYDEEIALEIYEQIKTKYFNMLSEMREILSREDM
ncbi:MAG: nucleotidyltransferase substrate binding protein [Clostridium sp.]